MDVPDGVIALRDGPWFCAYTVPAPCDFLARGGTGFVSQIRDHVFAVHRYGPFRFQGTRPNWQNIPKVEPVEAEPLQWKILRDRCVDTLLDLPARWRSGDAFAERLTGPAAENFLIYPTELGPLAFANYLRRLAVALSLPGDALVSRLEGLRRDLGEVTLGEVVAAAHAESLTAYAERRVAHG